jgi:hypothetical protein
MKFSRFSVVALLLAGVLSAQKVQDVDGKSFDLAQATAGKPFALIFVRSDCPISNRYSPALQALQKQYQDRVPFWLVYPDRDETAASIHDHLRKFGYNIAALRDPRQALVQLSEARVTPEAAVFAAGGKLVYHGRIDNWYESFGHARPAPTTHEFQDALEAVVAGRKPAVSTARAVGCYLVDLR